MLITVELRLPSAETRRIPIDNLSRQTHVRELRQRLHEVTGIPPDEQRLYFRGKEVLDYLDNPSTKSRAAASFVNYSIDHHSNVVLARRESADGASATASDKAKVTVEAKRRAAAIAAAQNDIMEAMTRVGSSDDDVTKAREEAAAIAAAAAQSLAHASPALAVPKAVVRTTSPALIAQPQKQPPPTAPTSVARKLLQAPPTSATGVSVEGALAKGKGRRVSESSDVSAVASVVGGLSTTSTQPPPFPQLLRNNRLPYAGVNRSPRLAVGEEGSSSSDEPIAPPPVPIYAKGDEVEAIDLANDAWFDAHVTALRRSAGTPGGYLYTVRYDDYEDETAVLPATDLRPRCLEPIDLATASPGVRVSANYNFTDPGECGFWYTAELMSATPRRDCPGEYDVRVRILRRSLGNAIVTPWGELLRLERRPLPTPVSAAPVARHRATRSSDDSAAQRPRGRPRKASTTAVAAETVADVAMVDVEHSDVMVEGVWEGAGDGAPGASELTEGTDDGESTLRAAAEEAMPAHTPKGTPRKHAVHGESTLSRDAEKVMPAHRPEGTPRKDAIPEGTLGEGGGVKEPRTDNTPRKDAVQRESGDMLRKNATDAYGPVSGSRRDGEHANPVAPPVCAWQMACNICKLFPRDPLCYVCGCAICGRKERDNELVVCDGCYCFYHMDCLDPPLVSIPTDSLWQCSGCIAYFAAEKSKAEAEKASGTKETGRSLEGKQREASPMSAKAPTPQTAIRRGPIEGIDVGVAWDSRTALAASGVHASVDDDVVSDADAAVSLVFRKGAETEDRGEELLLALHDESGAPIASSDCGGAPSIAACCAAPPGDSGVEAKNWKSGRAVRVVRAGPSDDIYGPKDAIFRYDGIYKVVGYYVNALGGAKRAYYFLMRRDDSSPVPWSFTTAALRKRPAARQSEDDGPSHAAKRPRVGEVWKGSTDPTADAQGHDAADGSDAPQTMVEDISATF